MAGEPVGELVGVGELVAVGLDVVRVHELLDERQRPRRGRPGTWLHPDLLTQPV
jgi:hypothetical protein